MTRLDIGFRYDQDIAVWWVNFCEQYNEIPNGMLADALREWNCYIGAGGVLVFEDERDAALFLLRWS